MPEANVHQAKRIAAADSFVQITDTLTTHKRPKGVYIGADGNYDFYDAEAGAWVAFASCVAGSTLPIRPTGARHTSGSTAPDANDVTFLY